MEIKKKKSRPILGSLLFILILLILFSFFTLLFLPKWSKGSEYAEMQSFYSEEKNSMDYLFLGACNSFSSFSPTLAYEEYGISGYNFGTPNQEIVVSYHYLKDAIKNQKLKTVLLESSVFYAELNEKNPYHNRLSIDYMPVSLNKIDLILSLGSEEYSRQDLSSSQSQSLLSIYADYFFPIFRYHSREDLGIEDLTYWINRDSKSEYKGGLPRYTYSDKADNKSFKNADSSEISEFSKEYFDKIVELCKNEGITLVLVNSPNSEVWNPERISRVEALANEKNIRFINFFKKYYLDNFYDWDYSDVKGQLNIFGMQKYTRIICEYLINNYKLPRYNQTEKNHKVWKESIEKLYKDSKSNNFDITPGNISDITEVEDGLLIRWNKYKNSRRYEIWRSEDTSDDFELVKVVYGESYLDKGIKKGVNYKYFLVLHEGLEMGKTSEVKQYISKNNN